MAYVELQALSNFTFLEGASHAEELARRAAELGHPAIAITDRNTLAGIVRAHAACKDAGIRLVVGARLDFQDAGSLLFYPQDRATYSQLCELLTLGRRRAPKGECQPMGFYAPARIVRDASEHGIEIRQVDINHSAWDNTLEPKGNRHALRLGFRQIRSFQEAHAEAILKARYREFQSPTDLARRAKLPPAVMTKLAEADAFGSLDISRRQALWQVTSLEAEPLPLFARIEPQEEAVTLPVMPVSQEVIEDYRSLALSLKAHPVFFLRQSLTKMGVVPTTDLDKLKPGTLLDVAGLVLVRQRPGSASGVIFMTIEDEVGIANLIVWPKVFEEFRSTVMGGQLVLCRGRLQREGEAPHRVIHVVANKLENLAPMLNSLRESAAMPTDFSRAIARADELQRPQDREKANTLPARSRDFH